VFDSSLTVSRRPASLQLTSDASISPPESPAQTKTRSLSRAGDGF
jgi:hypothetical protein